MLRFCGVLTVCVLLSSPFAPAQPVDERIGQADEFDDVKGWTKIDFPGEEAPLKEIKSEGGVGVFVTHPAPLRSYKDRPKFLDGMTGYDCFSNIEKTYPKVDLRKYHYMVIKLDERGTMVDFIFNGVSPPIAFTTGIHAVDLSRFEGFRPDEPLRMRIQFLNTGGTIKVDYIRFVSDLTPEEKKSLVPAGYILKPRKFENDLTQGLNAVMKRVDRPLRESATGQMLCFRDEATGALIWRMTGWQRGATVVSDSARSTFNLSGSHMLVFQERGGGYLYDFRKREFIPAPLSTVSRFSPNDPDVFWCVETLRGKTGLRFHKINIATGLDEVLGEIAFDPKKMYSPVTDIGFSSGTDMIAVGLRETPSAFIFDPTKPADQRVRMIELPMRLKGMGLSPDGKTLFWNRCYWYESWMMDLATGKTAYASRLGGSHAGGGGGLILGHYSGLIISAPEGLADPVPGDAVKILLNYRSGWHTDYGHLTGDRQWYIANGTGGDMAGQAVMAPTADPGTALQIAFQNTSRDNWGNNTVVRSSSDYTKLAWVCNLWGFDDVCIAFTRRSEPVYQFSGKREGDTVALRWEHPRVGGRRANEVMGYNLYRAEFDGPYMPLNDEPITGESYTDSDLNPGTLYRYIVCPQEYCGLEGVASQEFTAMPVIAEKPVRPTQIHHLEAEHFHPGPPARQVFDGRVGAWRYVHIRKELETESGGSLMKDLTLQLGGDYTLWLRVRGEGEPGAWKAALDQQPAGEARVDLKDWQWVKLDKPLAFKDGERRRLVLSSSDEGLAIDKVILSSVPGYVPETVDDRFRTPPGKIEYLIAKETTDSSVHLAWWNPRAERDLDYYNVYVGETPDFPADQAHLIASTRGAECLDWGLAPGKEYIYKIVAVNRRGLASEPAALAVRTLPVEKTVLLELSAAKDAKLDERLKVETKDGKTSVWLPDLGQGHEKDPEAPITWTFDAPVKGNYMIWCEYAPADWSTTGMKIPVELDDFLGGKAVWTMRPPFRSMAGPDYRQWKEDLWFVDKIEMYVWPKPHDVFRLAPGKHTLTLKISPMMREFHHKIGRVWITNNLSFRPPGWDPQADFTKSRITRK